MQQNLLQSYELLCLAGNGGQAQVFLARNQNRLFVLKAYFLSEKAVQYYERETTVLQRLHSPFIITLVECFPQGIINIKGQPETRPTIVLNFAERGDLFNMVNLGRLPENVARTLFVQLLKAIKAMKEVEVAHLDIKMQNILLDSNYQVKLTDFGYARIINSEEEVLESWQGTPGYIAPQLYHRQYRGYEADIFAAGVVLFYMLFRAPPFEDTQNNHPDYNLIRLHKYVDFWKRFERRKDQVPASLKQLFIKLFAANPTQRPRLSELEQNQWLLGATLGEEEMRKYFDPRYQKLSKIHEETMNIRKSLVQQLQTKLMECQKDEENNRSRSREGSSISGQATEDFIMDVAAMELNLSSIKQLQLSNTHYAPVQPKIILLWLHGFMFTTIKEKKCIFEAAEDVDLTSFVLQSQGNGEMVLKVEFNLSNEEQSWGTEVRIKGNMVQWDKRLAVLWVRMEGNAFWCSQLVALLKREFSLTFC